MWQKSAMCSKTMILYTIKCVKIPNFLWLTLGFKIWVEASLFVLCSRLCMMIFRFNSDCPVQAWSKFYTLSVVRLEWQPTGITSRFDLMVQSPINVAKMINCYNVTETTDVTTHSGRERIGRRGRSSTYRWGWPHYSGKGTNFSELKY